MLESLSAIAGRGYSKAWDEGRHPREKGGEFASSAMSAGQSRAAILGHKNAAYREHQYGNHEAAKAHELAAAAHEYASMLRSKRDPNANWKAYKARHWTSIANEASRMAGSRHSVSWDEPKSVRTDA